jgi:hypothetical protein
MKARFAASVAAVLAALTVGGYATAIADERGNREDDFAARLSGYQEVHFVGGGGAFDPGAPAALRGAISTKARGSFKAEINDRMGVIDYELTFEGLESDVTQAHIHFGQRFTVGGIVVWLCQTAGTPAPATVAALTPQCGGPRSNTVTGTITAVQVLPQVAQGIEAGAFEELVDAIRNGAAYANVHSTVFTPGEIRGHIDPKSGQHH